MKQLPFRCQLSEKQHTAFEEGGSFNLPINKEWKIRCTGNTDSYSSTSTITTTISRVSSSEVIYVSGYISYVLRGQTLTTKEFSKLMQSGSSSAIIQLNYATPVFPIGAYLTRQISPECFSEINGVLYIAFYSEIIGNDDECKNCMSLKKMSNDFARLLDPQIFSFPDVNLKCGDALIPTHKNILSARSAVFAAMFANEMKENRQNQVDITDLDESVVRSMLTFMYTGKTNLTVALASDLLFAADKYLMDDLKRVCCDFLKENISPENMLNIYVLGDLHDEDLKYFIEDYICNTCDDFSVLESTEVWKTFKKEKPNLALEIAISLVKSRDAK